MVKKKVRSTKDKKNLAMRKFTEKSTIHFKPWHEEWNAGGPGHAVVTRKYYQYQYRS
jgi:hypothetical protein